MRGKGYLYEGRHPRAPARQLARGDPAGVGLRVPVSGQDLYPTVREIAGVLPDPGQVVNGESLVPILKGSRSMRRDALFWHYPHYSNQGGKPGGAIRQGNLKLIEWYEDRRVELYDLRGTSARRRTSSAERPAFAAHLRDRLARWRESVAAQMPSPNPGISARETSGPVSERLDGATTAIEHHPLEMAGVTRHEEGGPGRGTSMIDDTVAVRQGRALEVREYGDPRGHPAFFFHGLIGSHHQASYVAEQAKRAGLRIIAPNRPGVGRSEFVERKTPLEAVGDVEDLAKALRIEDVQRDRDLRRRPYALAVLYRLADRVRTVTVISGMGPSQLPGGLHGMDTRRRLLLAAGSRYPQLARKAFQTAGRRFHAHPERFLERLLKTWTASPTRNSSGVERSSTSS